MLLKLLLILVLVVVLLVVCWLKRSPIPWIGLGDTVEINMRVWRALNKALIYPTRSGVAAFAAQPDAQNIQLYDHLRRSYGSMARVIIIWRPVVMVMSTKIMREVLNKSPQLYGPGKFKVSYFTPLMAQNVGINEYPQWTVNRPFNEKVLGFRWPASPLYQLLDQKSRLIARRLVRAGSSKLLTGQDFIALGRYVSYLVTFGQRWAVPEYYPLVWDLIASSDNWSLIFGFDPVTPTIRKKYLDFMRLQLEHPQTDSLMYYATQFRTTNMSTSEVIDQVPHWVFPLSNAMFNILTVYLLLLETYPDVQRRVQAEIGSGVGTGATDTVLHWSILETIRMYGIVLTLTRTSMRDQTVTDEDGQEYHLHRGDQLFMVTSMLSNDQECFPEPHRWRPERWATIKEDTFCDVIFNVGPQICPGSNLVVYLLQAIVKELLGLCRVTVTSPKLDPDNLPAALDPWKIKVQVCG